MSTHTKPSEKQTPLGVQDAGPCSQNHFKVYAMILEWERSYYISLSHAHSLFSPSPLPFLVSQLQAEAVPSQSCLLSDE